MHGLFPLSAYSPNKDAQTGTKRGGERPQEQAKATTQNRANTPKSLTAQMEPRYYGQVPFRGCSLMVKPQSSKLITRVRFPSSPRTIPSTLSGGFFVLGDAGNRFRAKMYSLARSESARSSSSSPPCFPSTTTGIASGRKYIPSRARDFRPPARHPLENYPERIVRTASTCGFVSSRARNPHAPVIPNNTGPPPHLPHPKKLHSSRIIGDKYEYLHQCGLYTVKYGTLIRRYSILDRKIQ